jgi:DNA (cytosine-5)-methyltransferase 1
VSDHPTIRAVDLFCGAGGLSWGLVEALEAVAVETEQPTEAVLAEIIDLVGVNHWERAIETHERNHPWARHFHDDVQNVDPRAVFDARDPDVTILSGGIECTHWSTARGGKPVDEQKRMPAWDFLTWVQKLRPACVLVENVSEFQQWGPIDDDGQPTRNGETFEQWIDSLHALGYSVDWQVLNAANYGDATSRKRLFILARREATPEFPEPTHSADGTGDTEPWRTAEEIIDWSEPGGSIWTRDLKDGRRRPLKYTTMRRIAEGIRRHCDARLAPFADALEWIGRVSDSDDVDASTFTSIKALRSRVVPYHDAPTVAAAVDRPFLVACPPASRLAAASDYVLRQQSGGVPASVARPLPTISSRGSIARVSSRALVMPRNGPRRGIHSNPLYEPGARPLHTVTAKNHDGHLVTPTLVRYSHGGATLSVDDPLPTIATEKGGVFALAHPYLCPMYNGRSGQRPRTRSLDRPAPTIPASKSPAGLATPVVRPFIDDCQGPPASTRVPLGTITATDRFALCVPECYPWGLDIRYRMLQPRELAAAQGFPDDYAFAGTKTETVEQIGNAVPVNLAQSLVESLLASTNPSLTDYFEDQECPDTLPADAEVAADGGERR